MENAVKQQPSKMLTGRNVTFIIACGCSGLIGYYYGARLRHGAIQERKPRKSKEVHEVIMFSDEGLISSKHYRHSVTPGLERVLYYLNLPRHTLDVCMYVLTCPDLCNVLLKLNLRRVKVRVIVDAEMAFASKSYSHRLQRQCIEVRWMKSANIMHHKFCLIDASTEGDGITPLLINGSLNWTKQATHGNYENVTVTSQRDLVEGYKIEFERLWVLFKPIV